MIHCAADASYDDPVLSCGYVLTRTVGPEEQFIDAGVRILNTDEYRPSIDWCPTRGEYRAVISAVRAALEYTDEALLVYTDSEPVRRAIRQQREWAEQYFHHSLFSFLGRFPDWHILGVDRERNEQAHDQARIGLKMGRDILEMVE